MNEWSQYVTARCHSLGEFRKKDFHSNVRLKEWLFFSSCWGMRMKRGDKGQISWLHFISRGEATARTICETMKLWNYETICDILVSPTVRVLQHVIHYKSYFIYKYSFFRHDSEKIKKLRIKQWMKMWAKFVIDTELKRMKRRAENGCGHPTLNGHLAATDKKQG